MAQIDIKQLEENFRKMTAYLLMEDENLEKENLENLVFTSKIVMDNWDFVTIDDFYEEGLIENKTCLPKDMWAVAVGYVLIVRYSLSIEEYIEWSKKQNSEYTPFLLKLVDIETAEYKEKKKMQIEKKKTENFETICQKLDNKHKVIDCINQETGFTLFGKSIKIKEIAAKGVSLYIALEKSQKFAFSVFENEFQKKCTDYKECSQNIVSVLGDAIEAAWVKCRRYLMSVDVSAEKIEEIRNIYLEEIPDISVVKTQLDDVYLQLVEMFKEGTVELAEKHIQRQSRKFHGGGFGIKGAAMGMIGASLLNSFNSGVADGKTKADAEQMKSDFEKFANELYIGSDNRKWYKEVLKSVYKLLEYLCIGTLFPDDLENQNDAEEMVNSINDISDKISGDELREVSRRLLFTYPYNIQSYAFLFAKFVGIRDELIAIASAFGLGDKISKWKSQLINRSNDQIIFSDMQIRLIDEHTIEFNTLKYCGIKYKISIPIEASFFDEDKWKHSIVGSIAQDFFMINISTNNVIRIWGGFEGKERFETEIKENSHQILECVNRYENMNIKDFSQEVKVISDGKSYRRILRGELIYFKDKKYDVYMLTYANYDIFFSICIGRALSMDEDAAYFKSVVDKIKIIRIDSGNENDFAFFSHNEVLDELQRSNRYRAKEYFEAHKNELDLSFAIAFRKRFKALLYNSDYAERAVNEYDYNTRNQDIIDLMNVHKHKGQYILYFSDNIIITDYYIIMWGKDNSFAEIEIKKIIEIIPVTAYGEYECICVRLKNGGGDYENLYFEKSKRNEYIFITYLINIALDTLIDNRLPRYYREVQNDFQKGLVFCRKCKQITRIRQEVSILVHIYCNNCNAKSGFLDNIIKDKRLGSINPNIDKIIERLEENGYYDEENEDIQTFGVNNIKLTLGSVPQYLLNNEIEKYILSQRDILDFDSAIIYRVLFKKILDKYANKSSILNEYDYRLSNRILSDFFQSVKQKGQYVLYSGNGLTITDFNIYIDANGTNYACSLKDLIEIIPMESKFSGCFIGVCFRTKGDKSMFVKENSLEQISELLDLVNIVLEIAEKIKSKETEIRYYENSYTKDNERIIYCGNCERISYIEIIEGAFLKHFCGKCSSSAISKMYEIIHKERIAEQKNGLLASLAGEIQKFVEFEKEEDIKQDGILKFVFSTDKKDIVEQIYFDAVIKIKYIIKDYVQEHPDQDEELLLIDFLKKNGIKIQNAPTSSEIMFCINCGQKIKRSFKFCKHCGVKVTYQT